MGHLLTMLLVGFISSLGALTLCYKLGIKKVLGMHVIADVTITLASLIVFAGTYSGMVAGVFCGLLFSVYLIVLRPVLGYETLEYKKGVGLIWVEYLPTITWRDWICG